MTADSESIAFVGLGNMGYPMVHRLLAAGRVVRAYDVQEDARKRAAAAGADVRGDLGETVADVGVVILMLPDSDVVAAVIGDPGMRAGLRPGSIVVDMSSSEPERTRTLGEDLAGRGVAYVDAPVSGGVSGAERGSLAIMVGGADDDVDRVAPILSDMGRILRAGPLGAGHAVKALNNLLSATHLWITCEAIVAGQRFGLEPAAMLRIFNESSGRSGSTENKWPNFILNGSYASGFGLRLMVKDIGIAVGLAGQTGSLRDLGEAVVELWTRAGHDLPPSADHTEVARWIAQAADDQAADPGVTRLAERRP